MLVLMRMKTVYGGAPIQGAIAVDWDYDAAGAQQWVVPVGDLLKGYSQISDSVEVFSPCSISSQGEEFRSIDNFKRSLGC